MEDLASSSETIFKYQSMRDIDSLQFWIGK